MIASPTSENQIQALGINSSTVVYVAGMPMDSLHLHRKRFLGLNFCVDDILAAFRTVGLGLNVESSLIVNWL